MRLSEALGWFNISMSGIKSPHTIKWYDHMLSDLIRFVKDADLEQVDIFYLRQWRISIQSRGVSPYTLHGYVRAARRFFSWCFQEELIHFDPSRRLEKPPLPRERKRGISVADRDAIIKAAANNPRDLAICRLLADTAARCGGIATMKINDLDLINRCAIVWEKGRGGSLKARYIYFKPSTANAIQAWLSVRPQSVLPYVFLGIKRGKSPGIRPLKSTGLYQILKRLAKLAGVTSHWNPHQWRHAAIRAMLRNGMSLPAVSQIAGHSSTQITGDIYGTFSEAELSIAHDLYSWVE